MKEILAYQENRVTTQTPGRVVTMLYEGAVKFLKQAVRELEAGQFIEKGKSISRAVDIIQELDVTLNMEAGGEIAQNLRQLYAFMQEHLFQANMRKDADMIRQTIKLLEELNEGWKAVATGKTGG
ncbi:MAG: flagellar export chaperone FliS [Phycisphaerae bacterium]|nr:flagellar export chaperone FliS [Phycisphaerae bacterium]